MWHEILFIIMFGVTWFVSGMTYYEYPLYSSMMFIAGILFFSLSVMKVIS